MNGLFRLPVEVLLISAAIPIGFSIGFYICAYVFALAKAPSKQ